MSSSRGFVYPILPASEPSDVLRSNGIYLTSWPEHDHAPRWRTTTMQAAMQTAWPVDAHVCGYTRLASDDTEAYRLHSSVLSLPYADDVYLSTAFVDIDTHKHVAWEHRKASQASREDVFDYVCDLLGRQAAYVYTTRAGVRVVFELASPVPIRLAHSWLKGLHTEAYELYGARIEAHDMVWDRSAGEWQRFFRLPFVRRGVEEAEDGSVLWGPPTVPLFEAPGGVLDNDLQNLTEQRPLTPHPVDAPSEIPPPPRAWESWVHARTVAGQHVETLRNGAPWGPDSGIEIGTRNTLLKSVLNSLAHQLFKHRAPPRTEDLYAIVAPSVLAETHPDGPTLDDAWRLAGYAAELAAQHRQDNMQDTQTPSVLVDGVSLDGAITPHPVAFNGPPGLVYHRGAGYVYASSRGTYTGPYVDADLYGRIQEELEIPVYRQSGTNMLPVTYLLTSYGRRAEAVEQVYPGAFRGGPWDETERIARVLTFPAPNVRPEHSDACATWLDALLSEASPGVADAVLRWLGYSTFLGHPTSALYLEGPAGAGKGTLAAAVAAQWRRPPVSFAEATGRFNAGLLRSPVVFGDEALHVDQEISGRFRSLVAERSHRVEEKNLPFSTLYGCPRVVFAANNPGLLQLIGGHGYRDLIALIGRILHVEVSARAVLPPQEVLRYWVTDRDGGPGALVRHIAYLGYLHGALDEEGRLQDITPPGRYMVPGVRSPYHVRLITSDPLFGAVLLVIVGALLGPPAMGVTPGNGNVRVNAKLLHDRWRRIAPDDAPRPPIMALARALEALAGFNAEEGTVDVGASYEIPGDFVVRAARDAGYGNIGRLEAILCDGHDTPSPTAGPFSRPVRVPTKGAP